LGSAGAEKTPVERKRKTKQKKKKKGSTTPALEYFGCPEGGKEQQQVRMREVEEEGRISIGHVTIRHRTIRHRTIRHARFDTVRFDTARFDTARFDSEARGTGRMQEGGPKAPLASSRVWVCVG